MYECSVCCDLFLKDRVKLFTCLHLICDNCLRETSECIFCYSDDFTEISEQPLSEINQYIEQIKELVEKCHQLKPIFQSQLIELPLKISNEGEEIKRVIKAKLKQLEIYQDDLLFFQNYLLSIQVIGSNLEDFKSHCEDRLIFLQSQSPADDLRVHRGVLYKERDYSIPSTRTPFTVDIGQVFVTQIAEDMFVSRSHIYGGLVAFDLKGKHFRQIYLGRDRIIRDYKGGFFNQGLSSSDKIKSSFYHHNSEIVTSIAEFDFKVDNMHVRVNGDVLYFRSECKHLSRLRENGTQIWIINPCICKNSSCFCNYTFSDDEVFVSSPETSNVNVYCIDTGKFKETIKIPYETFKITPFTHHIVVMNYYSIIVMKKDGTEIAEFEKPLRACSFDVMINGDIVVGGQDGQLWFL